MRRIVVLLVIVGMVMVVLGGCGNVDGPTKDIGPTPCEHNGHCPDDLFCTQKGICQTCAPNLGEDGSGCRRNFVCTVEGGSPKCVHEEEIYRITECNPEHDHCDREDCWRMTTECRTKKTFDGEEFGERRVCHEVCIIRERRDTTESD